MLVLQGDVNADGIVNAQDLALLSSNWLATLTPGPPHSGASVAGADSAAQVVATLSMGQSPPAGDSASAIAVNSPTPTSAASHEIGTSLAAATRPGEQSSLKNTELTLRPPSFVGPLQPEHASAFIGRIDALPHAALTDRVLSQATSKESHSLGPLVRSGIMSLVKSQAAIGSNDTGSDAVEEETVSEQWSSPIDDDLLATLAVSRRP